MPASGGRTPNARTAHPGLTNLPDGSVIVPADVAGELVAAAVRDLTARARRDGLTVSAPAVRVLQALHVAAERYNAGQAGSDDGTPDGPPAKVEISATDAAALLGCSAEYARRLCRSGRIQGRRIGRAWLIDQASLDAYRYR